MAHLDAAADPYLAIERQMYVGRPGEPADGIVRRLELKPSSTLLVVGGIGSGKTTQLLIARDRLNALDDTLAIYIDVSRHQDLGKLETGSLLAIAGLALIDQPIIEPVTAGDAVAVKRFRNWAKGHWEGPDYPDEYPDDGETWVPGVVTPPATGVAPLLDQYLDDFKVLIETRIKPGNGIVFLFDSLDRMTDLKGFADLVLQDIAAISAAGAGVVIAGPLRAMYGLERTIADRFDRVDHLAAVDVAHDSSALPFLVDVLSLRVADEMMDMPARHRLAECCGGVLRDLIQLGRLALEEAYVRGAEQIVGSHVELAADLFGRTLMIGMSQEDLKVLQRVRMLNAFVQTSEEDLALLATRRVLEYRNGGLRYSVHPTLSPLLEQLARAS